MQHLYLGVVLTALQIAWLTPRTLPRNLRIILESCRRLSLPGDRECFANLPFIGGLVIPYDNRWGRDAKDSTEPI